MTIIVRGTCGNCGGPVGVPAGWYGVLPPVPSCQLCCAEVKHPHGPVLEMEPAERRGDQHALVEPSPHKQWLLECYPGYRAAFMVRRKPPGERGRKSSVAERFPMSRPV